MHNLSNLINQFLLSDDMFDTNICTFVNKSRRKTNKLTADTQRYYYKISRKKNHVRRKYIREICLLLKFSI